MPNMMVTAKMCDSMREVLEDRTLTSEERNLLVSFLDEQQLKELSFDFDEQEQYGPTAKFFPMPVVELLRQKHPSKPYLHELLAGSSIEPPPSLPERKRDPELVARLDKIRTYLEDRSATVGSLSYCRRFSLILAIMLFPGPQRVR
jgi:hypothetical protein